MKFSYNWLQSFFKQKLPAPPRLTELLMLHFAEVEEIKREGRDFVLDIDVRPNRAGDCFSHIGIARETAAITGSIFRSLTPEIKESKELKAKDFVSVEIKDKVACPRYTVRVVSDVKVGPSPKWIQERLKVCGLRPINNIVDITNYVMLETGQPLHAFDFEKIESINPKSQIPNSKQIPNPKSQIKKIIVRFAKNNEKIITLDEEKYDLDENILVIADAEKPIAIAGIKGGKLPEINNKTKIVVLESANFNSRVVRRGSKRIDLKTDASWRFEHGLDPNLTECAINRAAFLIQQIAGGKIAKGLVDFYPKKSLPKRIRLDLDYIESLLGIDIPEREIKSILEKLGFKIKSQKPKAKITSQKSKVLEVEIPTRRLDVSIAEDLIEEIGRIYGYEKIKPRFPISSLIPPERNLDIFWEGRAKNILKESGFSEVYNYSFVSEKDVDILNLARKELIELENPLSGDYRYLRPSLLPGLLKNIQKNQDYFKEMKLFELGKVFEKPAKEQRLLTGVMTGEVFYQAKGTIDLLLNRLGVSDIWYGNHQSGLGEKRISWWHPKKSALIKVNGQRIGFLGEIPPQLLDKFKIKSKVIYFDIFFEKLQKFSSEAKEYRPISRFPSALRDIAVLVPKETKVEEVLNKIAISGGGLVKNIELFDLYEGEELPEGKKNLAFHIIYQAEDRTLSSKEIDETQNKIIKALEKNPEWKVRK